MHARQVNTAYTARCQNADNVSIVVHCLGVVYSQLVGVSKQLPQELALDEKGTHIVNFVTGAFVENAKTQCMHLIAELRAAVENDIMQQKASSNRRDRRSSAAASDDSGDANSLAPHIQKLHDGIRQAISTSLLQRIMVRWRGRARCKKQANGWLTRMVAPLAVLFAHWRQDASIPSSAGTIASSASMRRCERGSLGLCAGGTLAQGASHCTVAVTGARLGPAGQQPIELVGARQSVLGRRRQRGRQLRSHGGARARGIV